MATISTVSNHTPGPWNVFGPTGGPREHHYWINRRTPTEDGGYFCKVEAMHWTPEGRAIAAANAALIAAAPELFDVLCDVAAMLPVAPRMHPQDLMDLQSRVCNAIDSVTKQS